MENTTNSSENNFNAKANIRLIIISEVFYPELPGGSMRFYRYGPLLRERGIDIHVFTVKRSYHKENQLLVNGIKIHRIPVPAGRHRDEDRCCLMDESIRWHKSHRDMPACMLVFAAAGPRGALRMWRARLLGIPSAIAFTIVPDTPLAHGLRRLKQMISESIALSPYRRLFSLSRRMAELCAKRYAVRRSRFRIIPNGVDLKRFQPTTNTTRFTVRNSYGIAASAKVVLYVGAIVERKRIDIVLEAWPAIIGSHPNAILLIVGAQDQRASHDTPELHEEFSRYNERIQFLSNDGIISGNIRIEPEICAIENAFEMADIFVFPSALEGMPNAMLEAMACGLPSLVNGFEGFPEDGGELGSDGRHFIRCDGGHEEWSIQIQRLLDDEELRRQIGKNARQWVAEHQDLNDVADLLSAEYREIAE